MRFIILVTLFNTLCSAVAFGEFESVAIYPYFTEIGQQAAAAADRDVRIVERGQKDLVAGWTIPDEQQFNEALARQRQRQSGECLDLGEKLHSLVKSNCGIEQVVKSCEISDKQVGKLKSGATDSTHFLDVSVRNHKGAGSASVVSTAKSIKKHIMEQVNPVREYNENCLEALRQINAPTCLETYDDFFSGNRGDLVSNCSKSSFENEIQYFRSLMSDPLTGSAARLDRAVTLYRTSRQKEIELHHELIRIDNLIQELNPPERQPAADEPRG